MGVPMDFTTKTNAEMTPQERAEREARRAATRQQILADQASGAKRDKKALQREAAWLKKHGSK